MLLDEPDARVDEERDPREDRAHLVLAHARPDLVEHRDRGRHGERDLLDRRRARLLQVVGADVDRVPARHVLDRVGDGVGDEPQRRRRRERVGPAREVLLDDVVLRRALEHGGVDPVLLRDRDVERQQPRGGRVDRHRRVHPVERDAVEQRVHVALVADGHADLADLAARQLVAGVVAGLGREVEGDRQPGLPLVQVRAVERVRRGRGRMARVRAHHPRLVGLGQAVTHASILPHRVSLRAMRAIDTLHGGSDRVIAVWEHDGVLIDPGPENTLDRVLGELGDGFEPRAVLLTHIHFDHAGATGALLRRFPGPAGLRARARRAAHDRPRAARLQRRAALRRGGRPARAVGRGRPGARGERDDPDRRRDRARGVPRRVHARPRVAPRRLPARADRHGAGRGRRRRADPAGRLRARPDARRPTSTSRPGTPRSTSSPAGSRARSRSRTSARSTTSARTWTRCGRACTS